MRRTVTAFTIVITTVGAVGACGGDEATSTSPGGSPQTTVVTRPALSKEAVTLAAATLSDAIRGHSDAWNAMDPVAVKAFWDDDMLFEDTGNADVLSGDRLFAMPDLMATYNPDSRGKVTDVLVARDTALYLLDGWGVDFESVTYTEDDPFQEVGRIQLGAEGTFESWTIYYGIETYERINAPESLVVAARSLLDSYTAAWQSGDPAEVADLYSEGALLVDGLFDSGFAGRAEIEKYAADFFTWYPNAVFTQRVVFTDNRATINDLDRVGSSLTIGNVGVGGSACAVEMAVILTAENGRVIHEELFWGADSLISCGWAS